MQKKKDVYDFIKKINIKNLTVKELNRVVKELGYTIIPFKKSVNSSDVNILIDGLALQDYIMSCNCFTYQDNKYRLVFINSELSCDEKIIVLSHELGHILNKHMLDNAIFGADVIEEYEANEFVHYLMEYFRTRKQKQIITKLAIVLSIIVLSIGVGKTYYNANHYTENYYHTKSGTKYHLEECVYIKNRTGVVRMSKEEFNDNTYEPCSVCIPFDD